MPRPRATRGRVLAVSMATVLCSVVALGWPYVNEIESLGTVTVTKNYVHGIASTLLLR